jgi:EpsI family protein
MWTTYRRPLAVAALMVGALLLSVVATPHEKLADTRQRFVLDTEVPKAFGNWRLDESITPLPPSPDQQSVLNEIYDQILSRTYVNDRGERMMLSIAYGSKQNQQLRAHRQEVCYAAQGFKISGLQHLSLNVGGGLLPATRMVASHGGRVEPVTYWFTTGDTVVLSYWDREWAQLRYAMSGMVPDGYLVRISTLSDNPNAAFRHELDFANTLMSQLKPELRRRLVGHA